MLRVQAETKDWLFMPHALYSCFYSEMFLLPCIYIYKIMKDLENRHENLAYR